MASSAELDGRTVLITGASGGIGRAISGACSRAGARLWLVARTQDRLDDMVRRLPGGTRATAAAADMADPDAVRWLRERVEAEAPPDVLVNAAGGFELAPLADTDPAMFDRMIDGNLRGPFLAIHAFLPGMLERGSGDIVTLGSIAGRQAFPANGAYSASKFGVRGLHAVLDEELRGTGVRASLVEPAATDTPIWDPLRPDEDPDLPPRAAMQSPGAVADAVLFAITRPRDVRIPFVAVQRS